MQLIQYFLLVLNLRLACHTSQSGERQEADNYFEISDLYRKQEEEEAEEEEEKEEEEEEEEQ